MKEHCKKCKVEMKEVGKFYGKPLVVLTDKTDKLEYPIFFESWINNGKKQAVEDYKNTIPEQREIKILQIGKWSLCWCKVIEIK